MNVILSYLDNMFFNLPQSPEVKKAKEELASMMEDKYNELIADGKKEHEAIGIVISEFGDLEELKEELGLNFSGPEAVSLEAEKEYTKKKKEKKKEERRKVNRKEAEQYLEVSVKASKWVAVGVMLCIYSPIFLFLCGGLQRKNRLSDAQIVIFGLVPLFVMIAVAVGIFIYQGMMTEKFEYMKKDEIQLELEVERYLTALEEEERPRAAVKMIVGIAMCILAVIPLLISGSITDHIFLHITALILMFLIIGMAVAIIISGESKMECIRVLKQEGKVRRGAKIAAKLTEVISGVYWWAAAAIYLIWSFTTMNWEFTWVLWPIAGVIFWIIETFCEFEDE